MEILNWILAAFSTVCGGTALITLLMYRKQQKRFKTAEAFEKEVQALAGTVSAQDGAIETLQKQVAWQDVRIEAMQKTINEKDVYIGSISLDKHTLEIKHAKNKSAINKAYECAFCPNSSDCPVLKQRAYNEEEYLKNIQRENK